MHHFPAHRPLIVGALAAVILTGSREARRPPAPPHPPPGSPASDTIPGTVWTVDDWRGFESKVRWGVEHRLDTLSVGTAIARLGETFVGTTYRPATLEVPGPERLVVNLRQLDCVTFIENVLALTRFIRQDGGALLADRPAARARYEKYLRELRYRNGVIDGYASRLHYFSEWLAHQEQHGVLRLLARELGGRLDREPIDFMSTHAAAYRQLSDPDVRAAIVDIEARLNRGEGRWYIVEGQIAALAGRIQDGDLIAATSTVAGLDVAHTGLALWRAGRLHLLHAPLVGKSVEISELPLADRILSIASQDGIMVARVMAGN
ncbi:MAG TPA: N-acetylmuramoyl-L-alanine amidase-like domain-containing protein [Gemmatimonadales bacterium]